MGRGGHHPKAGSPRVSAPCRGGERAPGGAGQPRPAPRGRVPAPAATEPCSPRAGEGGWQRNPGHPRSRAAEGNAAEPSRSARAHGAAARPRQERRPPKEGRKEEGRRREGGRREGGREKCRLLPTPAGRTGHQSLQVPLWQLAQGGFARLQKCLWKAPEAEADGRGGLRMFWVLPRGTAVCTSGQALGTPLHGASFAYTSLAREIYSSRGVLRPYISLPLVSSQLPHQQAVTYFHTFILPSSSTGFMSLQTACTDAVG